jgi:predicted Rdx family selenoprotein
MAPAAPRALRWLVGTAAVAAPILHTVTDALGAVALAGAAN